MGAVATFLFVTGAPLTKKCAVAPESNKAYRTVCCSFWASKMVFAFGKFGKLCNFCCWTTLHHACCFIGNVMWHGRMCGAWGNSSSEDSSSVVFVVVAVASSLGGTSFPDERFDIATVTSSSSSSLRIKYGLLVVGKGVGVDTGYIIECETLHKLSAILGVAPNRQA